MHQTAHFPIGVLLQRIHFDSGLSRSQLAVALGYRSVTGCLRHFDRWIQTGQGSAAFLKLVADRFPAYADDLVQAVRATKQMLAADAEARGRAEFKPHVFVLTSRSLPTQITFFAVTGGVERWLTIDLPQGFAAQESGSQLALLKPIVVDHYRASNGTVQFMGEITGYRYARTYDESWHLDVQGNMVGTSFVHKPEPIAYVSL